MKNTSVERGITDLYCKTVGIGMGLYNRGTKELREGRESEPIYQKNLEIIRQALKGDWTAADLKSFVLTQYKAGTRAVLLSEILPRTYAGKKLQEGDNLLERPGTRHHSVLYTSSPPRYRCTEAGMELVKGPVVQQKESFTFKELCTYFTEQLDAEGLTSQEAVKGGLRWLLTQATLDQLLFAIDRARGSELLSPFQLTRHLDEAMQDILFYESRSC